MHIRVIRLILIFAFLALIVLLIKNRVYLYDSIRLWFM